MWRFDQDLIDELIRVSQNEMANDVGLKKNDMCPKLDELVKSHGYISG